MIYLIGLLLLIIVSNMIMILTCILSDDSIIEFYKEYKFKPTYVAICMWIILSIFISFINYITSNNLH